MKLRLIALMLLLLLLLSGCNTPDTDDTDTTPVDTTPPPSEIQQSIHNFFGTADADTPSCFVIQNYTDLQELYSIATNLPLEGNWPGAKQNDSYPESFFAENYLVAAMVKTDCPGYAFRSGGLKDYSGEISVYVHGERPFPFELSTGAALRLIPIEGQYAGEPLELEEKYTKFETQIQFTFENYFETYSIGERPEKHSPYIVIESYDGLTELYRCASLKPREYRAYHLYLQGNWKDTSQYNEQFFENNYILAVMTSTSSGSYTFECAAQKQDGKIIAKLDGTCPYASTDDIGGYLYLIPVEGKYAGETVEIDRTLTQEPNPWS